MEADGAGNVCILRKPDVREPRRAQGVVAEACEDELQIRQTSYVHSRSWHQHRSQSGVGDPGESAAAQNDERHHRRFASTPSGGTRVKIMSRHEAPSDKG